MPVAKSRLSKVGYQVEPFSFFQSSNSVEDMRIPRVVTFKAAFIWKLKSLFRGVFRAWSNIHDEAFTRETFWWKSSVADIRLDSKYKFMSFLFEFSFFPICVCLFE